MGSADTSDGDDDVEAAANAVTPGAQKSVRFKLSDEAPAAPAAASVPGMQYAALLKKSVLVKVRGAFRALSIAEILFPLVTVACMLGIYHLFCINPPAVPASTPLAYELQDVRWASSGGRANANEPHDLCVYAPSGSGRPETHAALAAPPATAFGFVRETEFPFAEEVALLAIAFLTCKTTSQPMRLKDVMDPFGTSLSDVFLAAVGLEGLASDAPFSFLEFVYACRNLVRLRNAMQSASGADDIGGVLAALESDGALVRLFDRLEWILDEDVEVAPTTICEETCRTDVACLRTTLVGSGTLIEFARREDAISFFRTNPGTLAAAIEFPGPWVGGGRIE